MMGDQPRKSYEKFRANIALARRIEEQLPDDVAWNWVVRFYAALHLMNTYLIDKHNVPSDPSVTAHTDRKRAMDRCPELPDAPQRYRGLKEMSEWIR